MKLKKNKHIGPSLDEHLKECMKDPVFAEGFRQEQIKHELAEMVKTYRQKAGLTQKQLADKTGLKQSAIARIESRQSRTIPSIESLRKIFWPLGYNFTFQLHKMKKAA